MSTYSWSVPTANVITGLTYIKDTDNKIQATIDDLADFVNGTGNHAGQGLTYDFVDKATAQTITGVKTFNDGIIGDVTGNSSTSTKLASARTISLIGGATGSSSFDGSANINIDVSVTDDSHGHSNLVPSGCIVMWSGSVASIPSGWYLCDGLNGTPNLMDRFIIGAGNGYGVGATGGNKDAIVVAHTHTFSATTSTNGGHTHTYKTGDYPGGGGIYDSGDDRTNTNLTYSTSSAGSHNHTVSGTTATSGSSGTNANLPPYYALAYIMKA